MRIPDVRETLQRIKISRSAAVRPFIVTRRVENGGRELVNIAPQLIGQRVVAGMEALRISNVNDQRRGRFVDVSDERKEWLFDLVWFVVGGVSKSHECKSGWRSRRFRDGRLGACASQKSALIPHLANKTSFNAQLFYYNNPFFALVHHPIPVCL